MHLQAASVCFSSCNFPAALTYITFDSKQSVNVDLYYI